MTLEQKNFLLGFLRISGINKEISDFEEKLREDISDIIDLLPKEERKKGLALENNFLDFIQLLKWTYFDYGASAKETLEDWNLEWIPEEPEISVNEEIKKIA